MQKQTLMETYVLKMRTILRNGLNQKEQYEYSATGFEAHVEVQNGTLDSRREA
jgi:hypothetical protein